MRVPPPDRTPSNELPPRSGRQLVHDLRNRLASVKMAVQGVDVAEKLSDRGKRRVTLAQKQVIELESLLDELAAFFAEEPA